MASCTTDSAAIVATSSDARRPRSIRRDHIPDRGHARDGEGGEPGTLAGNRRDDRADVQPVPGVDAPDVRRRHERRLPDPAPRHHPLRPVDRATATARPGAARSPRHEPAARPRTHATPDAVLTAQPPTRCCFTHAASPKSSRSPSPADAPGRSNASSTSTTPQRLQRHARHVGPDGERLPASTGEAATSSTDHHPARRDRPPSRPSRYAATSVASRPSAEISRPGDPRRLDRVQAGPRHRPGQQRRGAVVQRGVDQDQRVGPPKGP